METWDAIRTRRNVRSFEDRPLPDEHLERIVAAAALAPSSMNEQRWAFVVCRDRERMTELACVGDYTDHIAGAVAAIAFLTPRADDVAVRESIAFDLGQSGGERDARGVGARDRFLPRLGVRRTPDPRPARLPAGDDV